mgnify:FL=1
MKGKWIILGFMLYGACVQAKIVDSQFRFAGKVIDKNGRGVAGVVVNDGISFTTTDAQGTWALHSDTTRSKFVSISTPAGYVLPQNDGLADGFYVPVRVLALAGGKHDFVLEKRTETDDRFHYIAVSDPQVRNERDFKRWCQETVPDMVEVIDSLKQSHEVVGMTLGDLVWDNMPLFDNYKASLKNTGATFFQCIGNHDFDRQYQGLHNMELALSLIHI